jgi:hypothetical protein
MKSSTEQAKNTKFAMLRDALKLGCPYEPLQALLVAHPELPTDVEEYRAFVGEHPEVIAQCETIRKRNEIQNGFRLVYPHPRRGCWDDVLKQVQALPTEITMLDRMPMTVRRPNHWPALGVPLFETEKKRVRD